METRHAMLVVLLVLLGVAGMARALTGSGAGGRSLRGFVNKGPATNNHVHWRPLSPSEAVALSEARSINALAEGEQPLVKLFVALKENAAGLRAIEEAVDAASDPTRADTYSRHLEWDELNALVAPTDTDVEQVKTWLEQAGVERFEVMASRSWVRVEASADAIYALVGCRMRTYTPRLQKALKGRHVTIDRCAEQVYEIPSHLDHIVDFVTPIVGFPNPHGKKVQFRSHDVVRGDDQPHVTPGLLYKLYNVTAPTASTGINNTQAIFEIWDSYSDTDTQLFFKQYAPQLVGQEVVDTLGNMPNFPVLADGEASLDIQYIMAVGAFAPSYSYNYQQGDVFAVFFSWVTDLANDAKPPLVHSCSYGDYGADYPIAEVMRVSNEWMKLGARGITVVVASGDDGVGCNAKCSAFEFPYPSSPWITLVSSTQVHQDQGQFSEIGSSFGSGGFSNDFGIPSWQASQVASYLDNCPNLPAPSFYNRSGRALPDLAAAGENVQVIFGGDVVDASGTSCSAPIIAGMVSLWNGLRLKAGKSPMGFINPFLYKSAANPSAFYDVTSGNNAIGCCPGFNAFKGWDPVTGLGTPNFEVLAALVRALP